MELGAPNQETSTYIPQPGYPRRTPASQIKMALSSLAPIRTTFGVEGITAAGAVIH